ncbi:hypothetical protein ACWGKQ_16595 [Streptomyces sp. NPDC054770]
MSALIPQPAMEVAPGTVPAPGRLTLDEHIELASGDVFVFGGPSHYVHLGVHEGTPDPACGLEYGRLIITMRVTGLTHPEKTR